LKRVCEGRAHEEGNVISQQFLFELCPSSPRHAVRRIARRLVASVTTEREREREGSLQPKISSRSCWKLSAIPIGKEIDGFYYLQTCFLTEEAGILDFCAVLLGNCFPKFRRSFDETSVWNYPTTEHNNPEDLVSQ